MTHTHFIEVWNVNGSNGITSQTSVCNAEFIPMYIKATEAADCHTVALWKIKFKAA